MNKKLLSLLLALVMVFSFIPAFAAEEAPKADEKKAEETAKPAEEKKAEEEVKEPAKAKETPEYVKFLQDNKYVEGDKTGNLMLDKNLTRAEFTALLARLDGKDDVAKAMQQLGGRFSDVNEAHWAKGYISFAAGKGWVQGYPDGTFGPEREVTYAEIATVLVRYLGTDTAGFNYPTDYIAKAYELKLMKDLPEIKEYKQAATRDNMFHMLYNTISNRDFGKFAKYDMIVLENNRTAALKADQIKAEVLSVVQQPNNVDERGVAKVGTQMVFSLTKDEKAIADSENLIGKVIRATLDGDKLVKVEINKDYNYVVGSLDSATEDNIEISGDKYAVRVRERYYRNNGRHENDDRIYRTYLTSNSNRSQNFNYLSFRDEFFEKTRKGEPKKDAPNFVRATIKDGMVMFIDAFRINDIAPVKEVKRDGKDIYFYNDVRNGSVDRTNPARRIIGYTAEKEFYNMKAEDIKADDVIHMLDGITLVRQDAKIEDKLVKTFINNAGEFAVLGERDPLFLSSELGGAEEYYRSVYAYDNQHYRTTKNRGNIDGMRDKNVKVLLDLYDNIQLITSDVKLADTIGMVAKWNPNYPVFYAPNGEKSYDLDVVRSTRIYNGYSNGRFEDRYEKYDLVYTVDAGEGKAEFIGTLKGRNEIFGNMEHAKFEGGYYRMLNVGGNKYRFDDDTRVFVVNGVAYDKSEKLQFKNDKDEPINPFAKAYFAPATMNDVAKYNENNKHLRAYVLNEAELKNIIEGNFKYNRFNLYGDRTDLAKVVVFINYNGPVADLKAPELGRVAEISNYSTDVKIEVSRGTFEWFKLADQHSRDVVMNAGKFGVVEFQRVRDSKENEAVFNKSLTPKREGRIEFLHDSKIKVDGKEFYISGTYTKEFGDRRNVYAAVYQNDNSLYDADVIVYLGSLPNYDLTDEIAYNDFKSKLSAAKTALTDTSKDANAKAKAVKDAEDAYKNLSERAKAQLVTEQDRKDLENLKNDPKVALQKQYDDALKALKDIKEINSEADKKKAQALISNMGNLEKLGAVKNDTNDTEKTRVEGLIKKFDEKPFEKAFNDYLKDKIAEAKAYEEAKRKEIPADQKLKAANETAIQTAFNTLVNTAQTTKDESGLTTDKGTIDTNLQAFKTAVDTNIVKANFEAK